VKTAAAMKTAAGERMTAAKAAARTITAAAERLPAAKAAAAMAATAAAMAATAATPTPREHGGGSSEGNNQSDSCNRHGDRLPS
jgi:hypothetical protein